MMNYLKNELVWPKSAFCPDTTLAGGAVTIGLGGDGKDVCFQPFISYRGSERLSRKLSDVMSIGDHIAFDAALAKVPNRRMSVLSLRFWLDKFVVLLMLVTGNKEEIKSNIFDVSLNSFENPGGKANFPYDKPLVIQGANFRVVPLAGNPWISVVDEDSGEQWSLSLEVFSQVQHIRVRRDSDA